MTKFGFKQSEESKIKNRLSHLGKRASVETKKKMSEQRKKEKHPNWKGGRLSCHQLGYVRIYKPEHPFSDSLGYVYEHRLVMEQFLGRFLTEEEIVHHIDENTSNNNIINLQLMTQKEHAKIINTKLKRNKKGMFVKHPQR